MSANATSLQTNFSALVGCAAPEVQVILVQETKCTARSQQAVKTELAQLGWNVVWGKALEEWRSQYEAKAGVAILVRAGVPHVAHKPEDAEEQQLWNSCRWVRAKVACGGGAQWIDVTSVYCHVTDADAREELLQDTFVSVAAAGDMPCFVGGDFNTTVEDSATLAGVLDGGLWRDVAEEHARAHGNEPDDTFVTTRMRNDGTTTASRIDYVLANRGAFTAVKTVKVLADTGIPQHRPIHVGLDVAEYAQQVLQFRLPKEFPVDECSGKHVTATEQNFSCTLRWGGDAGDVDRMWRKWNTWAEEYLCGLCREHLEGSERAYRGRGREVRPQEKYVTPKTGKEGDVLVVKQRRLVKARGALDECIRWCALERGGVVPTRSTGPGRTRAMWSAP